MSIVKRGQHHHLTVSDLDSKGRGVGVIDGQRVFLRGLAVPGDSGTAAILRRKAATFEAAIDRMDRYGAPRVTAACRHVDRCGSCRWQQLARPVQADLKRRMVVAALSEITLDAEGTVLAVQTPGWSYFYRNKMEFSFGHRGGLSLGLHKAGRFDAVFDAKECLLQSPLSNRIMDAVREWARSNALEVWAPRLQSGCLRYLVIREGKQTGDVMVNLVTAEREFAGKNELADLFAREMPEVSSLWLTVNDTKASVTTGEYTELLGGVPTIDERLGRLRLTVSPQSFFQTNTLGAEALYEEIARQAALTGNEKLLDVCCGTGTIGLWLANDVSSVLGIDSSPDSIADAKLNAEKNGIDHAEFRCGTAEDELARWSDDTPDVVVVDPPRAGLHSKAVAALAKLHAPKIVYVSCNPRSMAADVRALMVVGYEMGSVQPVDMFPHTPHIEAVTTLTLGANTEG